MQQTINDLIKQLNDSNKGARLASLRELKRLIDSGDIPPIVAGNDVNNHIHTTYSFSPYTPTKAVWMAYNAGLKTAGIMDHDSVSGAREFIAAAEIIGILPTVGIECRVSMADTALCEKFFNNPDQAGVSYIALHGIPHQSIDKITAFFAPYREKRSDRNRKMLARINEIVAPFGIHLDYDDDVVSLSQKHDGGTVTERHLLFALALKIVNKVGKGSAVVDFVVDNLGLNVSEKNKALLLDESNEFCDYDLLGVLKSEFVEKFFIPATDECPPVGDVLALGRETGSICAYPYLGDVTESVTGDKKAQTFEDSFLVELFDEIKRLDFNAVTYMPSRNTKEQLDRLRSLCDEYDFFQISGEDINSPRQSFICLAQRAPEFANLFDATFALIGHEKAASEDLDMAFFSDKAISKTPVLKERIEKYKSFVI